MKRIDNCIEHTNFQTKEAKVRANKKQRKIIKDEISMLNATVNVLYCLYYITLFYFCQDFFQMLSPFCFCYITYFTSNSKKKSR